MLISHKGEYRVRGKEGPRFLIPAYAISNVFGVRVQKHVISTDNRHKET